MLTPRAGSRALTRCLVIERAPGRKLHLYGAESPHTKERPFVIRLSTIRSPTDVLNLMKDVTGRGWAATPADLLALGGILMDDLLDRISPGARS